MHIEPATEGALALSFVQASKKFIDDHGRSSGLFDLTADVSVGQIIALVGPSGSGKSTLLSLCNLFATVDTGSVYVLGKEVRVWDPVMLRRIVGLVFQNPTLFKGTVSDNLLIPARLHNLPHIVPEDWLRRVGLAPDFAHHPAEELSGGQKQRVALARTLANQPRILLLDEVTAALDKTAEREIEQLILDIHREQQVTVLWVTHSLEQAQRVSHSTWLMVDGRLAESGSTADFFASPKTESGYRFLHGEHSGRTAP